MDRGQQLPEQQDGQTHQHNGRNHAQNNAQHEDLGRALLLLLGVHNQLTLFAVLELEPAVVLVEERAHLLVLALIDLHLLHADGGEGRAVAGTIVHVLEHPGMVHLALDTVLQFLAAARARGALFAMSAGVPPLFVHRTLADAALADTVSGTDLSAAGRHAGVVGGLAGAACARPAGLADAAAAVAGTVIGAGAQLVLVPLATEVIALAERARDHLLRIGALEALTGSAHAIAPAGAVCRRGVVRPAAGIVIDCRVHVRHGALAAVAEMVLVAVADAAHEGAEVVAVPRVHLVAGGAGLFAGTGAQHLQLDEHALVDADGIDLDVLRPVARVFGALENLDLGREAHLLADRQIVALGGLDLGSASQAGREVGDLYVAGGIVLHLNGG